MNDDIDAELIEKAKTVETFNLKNEKKKALVIDVYDGDTITVVFKHFGQINKWKLRLLGINTPELRPSRSLENRDKIIENAKTARDYLSGLVLNKIIFIECGSFDSFGRILGYLYLNAKDIGFIDKSINQLMINSGNAVEY